VLLSLEKLKTTQRRQIKIPMDKGRNMLGVMDETGKLEEGQVHVQYTCKESNQFVTHRGKLKVNLLIKNRQFSYSTLSHIHNTHCCKKTQMNT